MKKYRLEDLKKSQVFTEPPEGYFDKLPGIIQAKTAHKRPQKAITYWLGALRVVPAAAAVVLIALYLGLFRGESAPEMDLLLADVSSEDIIEYLEELDLTNEEIYEEVDINELSLQFEEDPDPLFDNLEIEDETFIEIFDDLDSESVLL